MNNPRRVGRSFVVVSPGIFISDADAWLPPYNMPTVIPAFYICDPQRQFRPITLYILSVLVVSSDLGAGSATKRIANTADLLFRLCAPRPVFRCPVSVVPHPLYSLFQPQIKPMQGENPRMGLKRLKTQSASLKIIGIETSGSLLCHFLKNPFIPGKIP